MQRIAERIRPDDAKDHGAAPACNTGTHSTSHFPKTLENHVESVSNPGPRARPMIETRPSGRYGIAVWLPLFSDRPVARLVTSPR